MAPRVVTLMGTPVINEDAGLALEAITPGYLIQAPVAGVSKQTTADLAVPPMFALERVELGRGIDDSLGVGDAGSADYAIGETVKVGTFSPGDRVYTFIASGQTIVKDDQLDSAGDGTLQSLAGTAPMARALEAVTATVGDTRIRVEIM